MKYAIVKEHHNLWQFSKLHDDIDEVRQEAERLCRKENATFYIVEVLEKCYVEQAPVKWVKV